MGAEKYYFESPGDLFVRPITVRLRCTFSGGTGIIAKSTTRRQSDGDAVISGSAGTYTITGLPKGGDYHFTGLVLMSGAAVQQLTCDVTAFSPGAGTMTLVTRTDIAGGAAATPADTATLFVTFDVETGVY
jgi:hypothetical protein